MTKTDRRQKEQIIDDAIKASADRRKAIRVFLMDIMKKERQQIQMDADVIYKHVENMEKGDDRNLDYLKQCILCNEGSWEAFKACNSDVDLYLNTNKTVNPNRIVYQDKIYEVGEVQFKQQQYLRAMQRYLSGMLIFPLEAKMLSNLIASLHQIGMSDIAIVIYDRLIEHFGPVSSEEQAQHIHKATEQIEEIQDIQRKQRDQQQENDNQDEEWTDSESDEYEEESSQVDQTNEEEKHSQQENNFQDQEIQTDPISQQNISHLDKVDGPYEIPLVGFQVKQHELKRIPSSKIRNSHMPYYNIKQILILKNISVPKTKQITYNDDLIAKAHLRMAFALKTSHNKNKFGRHLLLKFPEVSLLMLRALGKQKVFDKTITEQWLKQEIRKKLPNKKRTIQERMFQNELATDKRNLFLQREKWRIRANHRSNTNSIRLFLERARIKYEVPQPSSINHPAVTGGSEVEWWKKYGGQTGFNKFCERNPCLARFYQIRKKGRFLNSQLIRKMAIELAMKEGSNFREEWIYEGLWQFRDKKRERKNTKWGHLAKNIKCVLDKSEVSKCLAILLKDENYDIIDCKEMKESMHLLEETTKTDFDLKLKTIVRHSFNKIRLIAEWI